MRYIQYVEQKYKIVSTFIYLGPKIICFNHTLTITDYRIEQYRCHKTNRRITYLNATISLKGVYKLILPISLMTVKGKFTLNSFVVTFKS